MPAGPGSQPVDSLAQGGVLRRASSDTIVAPATPPGVGAIGVVRLSGPDAIRIARSVFRPSSGTFPSREDTHRLVHGHIVDSAGEIVDEVMLAAMWSPRTFTREDTVEIDCHGGYATQRAVTRAVLAAGARAAEPGEFTRRAFLNGRIDLTQAEAVLAAVRAQSSLALRAAVRQLDGGLARRLKALRGVLLGVLAQLEVQIDFADEDPGDLDRDQATHAIEGVRLDLERLLTTAFVGRILDQGMRVAIVGRPNVGKSSLLNALAMRERAIVSDIPGTTRDTIEETIEIAGLPVCLVDTAGLRDSWDSVEKEGVERTRAALATADVVLAVLDLSMGADEYPRRSEPVRAGAYQPEGTAQGLGCTPAVGDLGGSMRLGDLELDPARLIVVGNKVDLVVSIPVGTPGTAFQVAAEGSGVAELLGRACRQEGLTQERLGGGWRSLPISAKEGLGIDELRQEIGALVMGHGAVSWDEPLLATERQRGLVEQAAGFAGQAGVALAAGAPEDIVAEDVRATVVCLGQITGEDLVEDLLDEVFSRFCIGK
ncbi:MAG: tRNA modification GTPase MnmE [Actinobacteria bacterium ADurb.Bin444]|nr:MAG: tRNA modification GTPase MnmE [Actinobacteria bacterium ADurb.Bin444]